MRYTLTDAWYFTQLLSFASVLNSLLRLLWLVESMLLAVEAGVRGGGGGVYKGEHGGGGGGETHAAYWASCRCTR